MSSFAHLHCHSEYSLLDGLSRINELVQRALELNQPAIALTDHGAMYGTMPFYRACTSAGIKPIIGIETYLAARTMYDKDAQLDKNRFHMLLLAQNQTGYLNLLEIASTAQLEGYYYKPRIDRPFMSRFSDGLIATTGCMAGEIPQAISLGRMELAHQLMGEYLDIFGKDRLFVELQEHSIPELSDINKKLIEMAPRYGLQHNFLATNDVHYTRAEDADPHQVLLCIQTSSTLSQPKMTFSDREYYLKSYDEMLRLFKGYPQDIILNSLQNSLRIADMCNVTLDFEGYHLPIFDVPEGFTPQTYLRHLCEQGLVWRYGENRAQNDVALRQRLDHELGIISRMGFETYFLIVWDLCEWAVRSDSWWEIYQDPYPYDSYGEWKKNDIWFNVRGSGAGSVVAYTLGITSIDPLVNGLIFERFLNPGRVSMPDIDLDYPDDVRPQMVAYAQRRYGREKVAQIITFGTMGARAAIRDVGRALDMPLPEVDAVARLVPAIPGKPVKIENVLDNDHEFYSSELETRYKAEEQIRTLLDTARNLEGVSRHASSHAAGVIISDKPLQAYVPLNKPTSGDEGLGGVDRVTQWPMEVVESIGLLKVDFLGLSTLTVMRRAARLIEERHGISYTMDNIPYDEGHIGPDPSKDPGKLFDMLERGEVAGVFQVEGCLGAETLIGHRTIKELYQEFQQKNLTDNYIWSKTLKTSSCYLDEGKFRPNAILNVVYSGIKPVYRLTDHRGHWIKATADHYFLTNRGWARLGDLDIKQDLLLSKSRVSRVRRSCTVCGQPLRTGYIRAIYCETCSAKITANPSRPEVKQKIAQSKLGTVPWNKGLTAETAADTTWIKNLRIYNESQKGVSLEERVGVEKAAYLKQQLSERNSGQGNPMYGRVPSETKTYSKAGYRPDLGHYVRSTWEADLARVFVYHNLAYQYEPQTFELIDKDGKCLTYTPDFYVPALETWFEVKGWMDKASAKKIHLFQEQYPENQLFVVDKTAFAEFQLQYADLVEWECPQFPQESEWVAIKSIEYIGEEETYDIKMRPPGNNFIASGFVVHNSGMRRLMMEMRPRRFDHIIAAISLYRPGPMDNIPAYIRRMHGEEPVEYHHPALEPIFGDTYGICVAGDAVVMDARNGRCYRLDELQHVSDFVIQGVDEQWRPAMGRVTHWIDSGHKDVYEVTLRNGAAIKVTADHCLLTEEGWLPLSALAVGGYIATPPYLLGNNQEWAEQIDRRKLRVLAYLIGDGSLASMASADFVSKEDALLTEYVRCLSVFTDVRPSYTEQVRRVMRVGVAKNTAVVDAHYHTPNSLLAWLRELGLKNPAGSQPGGARSHEKFVPPFVFELGEEDIAFFLASLWDCDGHFGKKLCHYKTVSAQLARDVQTLLLRLGIQSTIYRSSYEARGECRESYQITVYDTKRLMGILRPFMASAKRDVISNGQQHQTIARLPFIQELDEATTLSRRELMAQYGIDRQHFMPRHVAARPRISAHIVTPVATELNLPQTQQRLNVHWEEIVSIEHAGIEHVYDLTVAGLHSFVANNIIVHNCVYQEQIIRVASDLAGYEPGEADMIRKAVSKKKKDLIDKHRIQFTDGAMARGFSQEVCDAIWGDIEFFARYGFNKSHAADYAKVTCQTAFLKAHYPVEYLTAMLSVERDNTDKVRRYFAEAKNLGIDIAPPDVNLSGLDFTIEDGERSRIRFGLGAVKNAGEGALNLLLEEREANGRFSSLQNLCDRVDLRRVGKRALEFVIKARAFDAWGQPDQLLAGLDRLVSYSSNTHSAASAGQMSLFGALSGPSLKMKVDLLPADGDYKKLEHKALLEWEKEALGVHVSEHPLERPLAILETHTSTKIGDIDVNWSGKQVKLAGMISQLRTLTTKKGDPMAFGTLEDLDHKIEVVFFPRTWREVREEVQVDQVMLVTGKVQTKDDQANIIVDRVQTKVETAQAADVPMATDDWHYGFAEEMMEMPTNGRSSPPSPISPTNGSGIARPAPAVTEPTNGYPTPPPPPNFEETDTALPVAQPTPPPKVESKPVVAPPAAPLVFGEKHGGINGRSNGKHKLIIVEVKPVGNWHHAFRQTVKLAQAHQGDDQIRLRLAGQSLAIDFPDHTTCYSTELVDQIERLPGILRVYAV